MKKLFYLLGLAFVISFLFAQHVDAGPGSIRGSKVVEYLVISDSTVDGFTYDLLTNADTNYYYLVTDIHIEIDTGVAFAAAGTDSVIFYTRTESDTTVIAMIPDTVLTSTVKMYVPLVLAEYRTRGSQVWVESPASIYTTGERDYYIKLYYIKIRKRL